MSLENTEVFLQTCYSDRYGSANYYAWNDGQAREEYGYFVSLAEKRLAIKICDGTDIFGVTISSAAFIGNQSQDGRDRRYGLVATEGAVEVRCESDVRVGDTVTSNDKGVATKTNSGCGYKVIAIETRLRVDYAIISLGVQACLTDALGQKLQRLDGRMGDAETNIAVAINVANEAHNKAGETLESNQNIANKVDGALGVVDDMVTKVDDLENQVMNTNAVATQARAIAEGAATFAESMKNEAIDEVNKALAETTELRKEFEVKAAEIDIELNNAALEIQAARESIESTKKEAQDSINDVVKDFEELEKDLEPLVTWPEGAENPTGVAGFVARADENGVILSDLVMWKDGDGDESLAGFVSKATAENAEVQALANYKYTDSKGVEHRSVAALDAYAKDNEASINLIAGVEGGLAGLQAQVNENTASISTLASHVIGDYIFLETWNVADKDTSKIYYAEDTRYYWYYDNEWKYTDKPNEAGLTGALAGIQQTADNNAASIEMITSFEGDFGESIAEFVSEATAENVEIQALATYGYVDDNGVQHYGAAGIMAEVDKNKSAIEAIVGQDGSIAGLQAQVDANKTEVDLIAKRIDKTYESVDTWATTGKNQNVVYYAKDTKYYWYYADGFWKYTAKASEAGLPSAIAGIQVQTDDNSSKINSLTSWQGDTNVAMARIEQKADANGAYIQNTVSNMDKYSVGPHSQAYGFTLEQAREVLEGGMIYVPTKDVTETYNCGVDEDGNTITYTKAFNNEYYYVWEYVNNLSGIEAGYMWNEYGTAANPPVYSGGTMPAGTAYSLWYTNSDTVTDGYEPYTLYKLEEYQNEAGETLIQWVAVATLQGNSSNRAVSQIRQDANGIELRVTNVEGSAATSKLWIDSNSANIQDVVSWKSDVADDVSNIATIKQTADNASASIAQVVEAIGENGEVNAASIVTAVNKAGSSVVIDADHVNLNGYVTMTNLSSEGKTEINGANITTGKIDAERIKVTDLKALGANIAGWEITENQLFYEDTDTGVEVGLSPGQGGAYGTNQNLGLVLYAGTKALSDPKAIAGTWRFADSMPVLELNTGQIKFNFSGWLYHPTNGWHKYEGQPAFLSFAYDDSTGSQTIVLQIKDLDSGNYASMTLYGRHYNSYTGKYEVTDSISRYLLNREIGFGLGIDDFSVLYNGNPTSSFLNDILKPNATFIPGSIGLYPSMLDKDGRLYAEEIRLGGSANSVIEVDRGAIGNIVVNDDAIVYKKGWKEDGGFYLGKDGLSVGSNFAAQSQGVSTGSIIVGGAENVHENGTVACKTLKTTNATVTNMTATNIEGNTCTVQGIDLNDINGTGAAILHSDADYVHCNAKFMLSVQENGSTSGRWQGMMIDFGADTLKTSSSTALRIGPVAGGFQVLSSGTVKDTSGNVVHTSDARLKHDIESLDERYDDFFDNLEAQRFKYNVGTSDRYHVGYTTQGVQAALAAAEIPEQEFAGVVTFNQGTEDEESALRYYEFVSLNTDQIQKLKKRVDALEAKNAELEERLAKLEALLINNTQ